MKLSWGFFFSSLSCAAAATSPTVSPNTARLIIAQRLGLSRFHSIETPDAETIRHINAYGGPQPRLFGGDDDRSKAHLLIWREDGLASEGATVVTYDGTAETKEFDISVAPSPADNDRLMNDFISQAESLQTPSDPKKKTYRTAHEIKSSLPLTLRVKAYNEYLNILRLDKTDNVSPESMVSMFHQLKGEARTNHFAITFVTMPAASAHSKRAANAWGTYDLPASNEGRRENPEMILSSNAAPSSAPAPVADLEDFPVVITKANDTSPVRGILPSCFDTQAACEKQTHGCSGHGECAVKRKGRGKALDCYSCMCVPTVESHDSGMESHNKTTYWGGPACQKKDISVQFWLFVMVGTVLAFLISAGIGMLYSMGAEELPSVIGAGVSGPVRK